MFIYKYIYGVSVQVRDKQENQTTFILPFKLKDIYKYKYIDFLNSND